MPALLERPKMTRAMYEALKRHIMKEREKKKQEEQEQDAMMERLKKEREMRKKKEEQDSLTLEETKEQILSLQKKLDCLKTQKQDFFSQLKKVLNQEEETRKRAQLKEQSELTMSQAPYQHPHLPSAQPMILHGRPALYKATVSSLGPIMQPGIKRQRSPTPPPQSSSSSFQSYHSEVKYPHTSEKYSHSESKYSSHAGDSKFAHADPKYLASYAAGAKAAGPPPGHLYGAQHAASADYKNPAYQPSSTSHLYSANQSFQQQQAASAASYPGSQAAAKFTGPQSQSAFSSYQGHYAQSHPQKALAEQFPPAVYSIQRMQQPGYHAGIQLPQGIEHPSGKQGGFEDKYKLGQSQIRGIVPAQQAGLMTTQLQLQQQHQHQQQQQQQAKNPNAFVPVSGYPARSQAAYPTSTSGSTYTSQGGGGPQGRAGYPQAHGRPWRDTY